MDPVTHGVASLALQRAFWPRASWRSVLGIIAAGVIADLDWFSATRGPAAFLRWHRTVTHSLVFVLAVTAIVLVLSRFAEKSTDYSWRGFPFIAVAAAGLLHLLLDATQADTITPLWPFSSRRIALDSLPNIDPWLLAILALAILLPELFRLVGEEIGSRAKRPRGRNGAIAGLALAALYIGFRLLLHGNAAASLDAHAIAGDMPRRVAAFPDSASPFVWHGVVESENALHLVDVRSSGGEVTYEPLVITLHKPDPSPMLSAAQNSPAAITFLKHARFPKATVQIETQGFSVEIQDVKDQAIQEKTRAIFVDVNLHKDATVISSELQWQKPH